MARTPRASLLGRPPKTLDAGPVVALRQALQDQRRAGMTFEDAWPVAIAAAEAAMATDVDRLDWPLVFTTTADAWRRAFDGEPATRGELLVAALVDATPDAILRDASVEELELAADRPDPFEVAEAA